MEPVYILYRITCKPTGKIYVGVHKSWGNKASERYLGSGLRIRAAVKKYGRGAFTREVLKTFDTSQEAFMAESMIVTKEFLNREDVYNLALGGRGGILSAETIKKMSAARIGKKLSEKHRKAIAAGHLGMKGTPHKPSDKFRYWHKNTYRKLTINGTTYESCKAAAKALGLSPARISALIKEGKAIKHGREINV